MNKSLRKTKRYAAILTFSTLTAFIENLKNTVVPPVIDTSLIPKMSGSNRSILMSTLRFLSLINAKGVVQERLHVLVKAYGTEDWKQVVVDNLYEPYRDIVDGLDLDNGTQAQLYEAFRARGNVDGQMLERAVRFYLAMLAESGAAYSPHFKSRSIRKTAGKRRKKAAKMKPLKEGDDDQDFSDDPLGALDDAIWARFQIPIPDRGIAYIALPVDIDADDWKMVSIMLDAYVQRLTKE